MRQVLVSLLIFTLFVAGIGSRKIIGETESQNAKPEQNSGIEGIGIGWADVSAVHTGNGGSVTINAVASSHSTLTIGQDGEITLASGGHGLGTGTGTAEDPNAASLQIHASGGGNGTSIIPDEPTTLVV